MMNLMDLSLNWHQNKKITIFSNNTLQTIIVCIQIVCIQMADTSLNENRIGLLIWQTSNLWQSKLRNKLSKYNISFNEYLIIETVYNLSNISNNISQIDIVYNSFIDKSVVSAKLSQLAKKKLIKKMTSNDNRSNRLILTKEGINIIESIIDEIISTEKNFFGKLNEETFNFINSLKLLLGKKIRIKANYNE